MAQSHSLNGMTHTTTPPIPLSQWHDTHDNPPSSPLSSPPPPAYHTSDWLAANMLTRRRSADCGKSNGTVESNDTSRSRWTTSCVSGCTILTVKRRASLFGQSLGGEGGEELSHRCSSKAVCISHQIIRRLRRHFLIRHQVVST